MRAARLLLARLQHLLQLDVSHVAKLVFRVAKEGVTCGESSVVGFGTISERIQSISIDDEGLRHNRLDENINM